MDHNHWLGLVFVIYVLSLFFFALVYWVLHLRFPGSFAFNADVSRSQDTTYRDEKGRAFQSLQSVAEGLDAMAEDMKGERTQFRKTESPRAVIMRSQGGYEAEISVRRRIPSPAVGKEKVPPLHAADMAKTHFEEHNRRTPAGTLDILS